VTVTQDVQNDTMRLSVVDDGGADTAIEPGFGLRSLAERAAELGGRTEVHPTSGGVEVTASVPLGSPA
jgi:signal transduction histidine kinase